MNIVKLRKFGLHSINFVKFVHASVHQFFCNQLAKTLDFITLELLGIFLTKFPLPENTSILLPDECLIKINLAVYRPIICCGHSKGRLNATFMNILNNCFN